MATTRNLPPFMMKQNAVKKGVAAKGGAFKPFKAKPKGAAMSKGTAKNTSKSRG